MSRIRHMGNSLFTSLGFFSVLLVAVALVGVLLPIVWKGSGAVVFQGTVDFRRLQSDYYGRGDHDAVQQEFRQAMALRMAAYDLLERHRWLNEDELGERAKTLYTQCKELIEHRTGDASLPPDQQLSEEEATVLRRTCGRIQSALVKMFDADTRDDVDRLARKVLDNPDNELLLRKLPQAARMVELASDYRKLVAPVDLSQRQRLKQPYMELKRLVNKLLGPSPYDRPPSSDNDKFGITHWPQAQEIAQHVLLDTQYENGVQKMVPREKFFEGTELAQMFPIIREQLPRMMRPQWSFYWQYFFDDARPGHGHFFGGIGPEVLGTILLTVLAILFALPLGVISAAYLVECTREGLVVNIIRVCINTLAGVPSIVFGLFGLAFFVGYLLPALCHAKGSNILAGALTLALLVLPVVIRASEEAIRSVPATYREAALGLGASKLRCFLSVTLPAALPGVLTGVILSMSRAAGETAPILFTAAVASGNVPTSLLEPTRTLSYGSYDISVGDTIGREVPYNQFGMVSALVLLVLILNVVAIVVRSRVSRRLRGQ